MVEQWLVLLPHSENIRGLNPLSLLIVCRIHGFALGTPASSHSGVRLNGVNGCFSMTG